MKCWREAQHPTRYPALLYRREGRIWRIVDAETGKAVGDQYRSRAELLADLGLYAALYGCAPAGDGRGA